MPEDNKQPPGNNAVDQIGEAYNEDYERLTSPEFRADIALDPEKHLREWKELRVKYLGKKSALAAELKNIGSMDPKSRREAAIRIQKREREISSGITRE